MHKGKRMCVVIGGRVRMNFLCSILLVPLLLVYGGAERESKVYDYRLLIGNSALVKSCPVRLTLPLYHSTTAPFIGHPQRGTQFDPQIQSQFRIQNPLNKFSYGDSTYVR